MRTRLLLVVALVLAVTGTVTAVQLAGDDHRAPAAQRWTDFDKPPWTEGIGVGQVYEYSVNAHCGVHSAPIDGTNWRADPPIDDGMGNPPKGWERIGGIGRLRIVGRDRAVFENRGLSVTFVRDDLPDGPPCA